MSPDSPKARQSRSIARVFGASAEVAQQGVRALSESLSASRRRKVRAALEQWQAQAAVVYGEGWNRPSDGAAALAAAYGLSPGPSAAGQTLFAVQTYYALVVRRLSRRLVGAVQEEEEDVFSWYRVGGKSLQRLVERIDELAMRYAGATGETADQFRDLYEAVFPRKLRHAIGEYYTPQWLVQELLDETGYHGAIGSRLLDPACGSGVFLVEAIRRIRAAWEGPLSAPAERAALCAAIGAAVVGFDLNPLAVLTARANYRIALGDLLPAGEPAEIPVHLRDSILHGGAGDAPFDHVVGNPPWIAWDHLPAEYREATKSLWRQYGLFSLSHVEARHGGAKKDLSSLMLYVAADRYLKDGGRLAMVMPQTLFQTKGAGDGFRRFRLGEAGPPLRVLGVHDLVAAKPFASAANWTATLVLEKGSPTTYPVPYVKWSRTEQTRTPDAATGFQRRPYRACPSDPDQPTSPWFLWPTGWEPGQSAEPAAANLLGPSDYQAHLGANTGGANGVYWLEILDAPPATVQPAPTVLVRNIPGKGKRVLPRVEQRIETELVFPLLRWADVTRYRAVPKTHLLMVQDVQTRHGIGELLLYADQPLTYAYLWQFRVELCRRAAYRRYQEETAFYSMYDVGPYTLAPIKVVWRRMDRRINAAVVEPWADPWLGCRPVIPQETCVLIAADSSDEAHYLCGLLNSAVVNFLAISHSVRGGKGFGSPSMLEFLRLRRFDPSQPDHHALAAASRDAHQAVAKGEDVGRIQECLDELAARQWGLDRAALATICEELEQ